MSRYSGKNGKIMGVSSRTDVIVAQTMTDQGSHTVYVLTGKPLWDSSIMPKVLVNGTAPAVAFVVDYISGSVTFASALGSGDVVTVNNFTYSTLIEVGDFRSWAVNGTQDIVDITAFQDEWHKKVSTFKAWSGTLEHLYVSSYLWNTFVASTTFYVKLYVDMNDSHYWVGDAWFSAKGMSVPFNGVITEAVTLEGTNELRYV